MTDSTKGFDLPSRNELIGIYASFFEKIKIPAPGPAIATTFDSAVHRNFAAKTNANGRLVRDAQINVKGPFAWGHYHHSKVSSDTYHQEARKLRAMGYLSPLK